MDSRENDAFFAGFIVSIVVLLSAFIFFENNEGIGIKTINNAINACKKANTELKIIYNDKDAECQNGLFIDAKYLRE